MARPCHHTNRTAVRLIPDIVDERNHCTDCADRDTDKVGYMPYRLRSTAGPGDVEIAYRVSAPYSPSVADRPTLLFIHGWAQTGAGWGLDLLESFARDQRVVAVDLRGHGSSGVPVRTSTPDAGPGADFSAADFAGDIAAVITAESSPSGSAQSCTPTSRSRPGRPSRPSSRTSTATSMARACARR